MIGVNLVGLINAEFGFRFGTGTTLNVNYSVPRAAEVAYLAANGYTRTRLPIKWEMLQPVLSDARPNAATIAILGQPGAFHPLYQAQITSVLDAHAAAGIKCVLDLHNYCRYRDFVYQPDGSVIGLTKPVDPLLFPYTTDNNQVHELIFALAPGATLTQAAFVDFWTRAATLWKNHPGLGGYGLMNEPYNLPSPGQITQSFDGTEDLHTWPTYAQAAINAIRAIDPVTPIYLDGNTDSAAWTLGARNPDWPLAGANLIYEVHMYLDAGSSGQRFDFDSEVARGFSANSGAGSITLDTGWQRLQPAVEWAAPRGLKVALAETGMPIDDPRWQEMYQRLTDYAFANNVDVYHWNAGNFWSHRNAAISFTPGWHQNKMLEPAASGPMKKSAGIAKAVLFDDGPGWAPSGTAVTITVYARGYLAAPVNVTVTSSNGGTLSKSTLTLPAGANSQDQFTFTSPSNAITTLSYSVAAAGLTAPPPRRIFSLADPVAYAATSLPDAALAIIAKYSACKWELADGYTDFFGGGVPAAAGQSVRAIADSGYGSSPGNAMEMLNWINETSTGGQMTLPTMRVANGKKNSDHSAANTWGFWCKKTNPFPQVQPNPKNRTPYDVQDPHFTVAAVSVPSATNGVVFQSSFSGHVYASELRLVGSQPQAHWVDQQGNLMTLTSPTALPANQPAVLSLTSVPGAQRLRVNSTVVGSGATSFSIDNPCDQLLIGMGFTAYFPRDQFTGNVYSVITGKGAPTVLETGSARALSGEHRRHLAIGLRHAGCAGCRLAEIQFDLVARRIDDEQLQLARGGHDGLVVAHAALAQPRLDGFAVLAIERDVVERRLDVGLPHFIGAADDATIHVGRQRYVCVTPAAAAAVSPKFSSTLLPAGSTMNNCSWREAGTTVLS